MSVTFSPDCFDSNEPEYPDRDRDDFDPTKLIEEKLWHDTDGWEADPQFRVVADTVERAADALLIAADRFMCVGYSGMDYGPAGPPNLDDDYVPNSTRVSVDSEAAYVSADTKGWLSHEMATTMKRILVEELTRLQVSAAISPDYFPSRGFDAERWPSTPA